MSSAINPRYDPPGECIGDELTIIGRALQAYLHTEADAIVLQHALLDEEFDKQRAKGELTHEHERNIAKSKAQDIAWLRRAEEIRDKYIVSPVPIGVDSYLEHARKRLAEQERHDP